MSKDSEREFFRVLTPEEAKKVEELLRAISAASMGITRDAVLLLTDAAFQAQRFGAASVAIAQELGVGGVDRGLLRRLKEEIAEQTIAYDALLSCLEDFDQ